MEFKLLALQINKKNQYTKNLKIGELYHFTEEFEFVFGKSPKKNSIRAHDHVIDIRDRDTYPKDLYDLTQKNAAKYINITAILGKNGAGKSTLLELLYLLIYSLSERKEYLNDRERNAKFIENDSFADHYKQQNKKINDLLEVSQLELIYKFGDDFCLIANSGKQINFYVLTDGKWAITEFKRSKFFYTICVNYSLHGLNSTGDYFWLDGLFHKNDGYKTPLVITPWRDQGNVDINRELHLAQTRIMSNLIGESFESRSVIDDKTVSGIRFKIVPQDIGKLDVFTLGFIYRKTKEVNKVDLVDIFEKFMLSYDPAVKPDLSDVIAYLKTDLGRSIEEQDSATSLLTEFLYTKSLSVDSTLIKRFLAKYILAKIVKICMKYSDFRDEFTTLWPFEENKVANVFLISKTAKLTQKLKADRTHVSLKLKQAINAFLFDYLLDKQWSVERNPDDLEKAIYTTELDFTDFQSMIKNANQRSKQKGKVVVNFIPTGFFVPTISVSDINGSFQFGQLSSGEQQMVQAIHSILYHILNLDSLADANQPYQAVNLVLDEIELYYHPEYQRLFISRLLDSLSKLKLRTIKGFNVIFSTHSPFILSDIPHRNVLKLRTGKSEPFNDEVKTFGSNIHEMLTDSFFLDENLIGAFAETKIKECLTALRLLELGRDRKLLQQAKASVDNTAKISRINEEINTLTGKKGTYAYEEAHEAEIGSEKILKTINMVGEPVIKYKLLEMYDEILSIEDRIIAKAKREIQEIMERTGIKKEDIR